MSVSEGGGGSTLDPPPSPDFQLGGFIGVLLDGEHTPRLLSSALRAIPVQLLVDIPRTLVLHCVSKGDRKSVV